MSLLIWLGLGGALAFAISLRFGKALGSVQRALSTLVASTTVALALLGSGAGCKGKRTVFVLCHIRNVNGFLVKSGWKYQAVHYEA